MSRIGRWTQTGSPNTMTVAFLSLSGTAWQEREAARKWRSGGRIWQWMARRYGKMACGETQNRHSRRVSDDGCRARLRLGGSPGQSDAPPAQHDVPPAQGEAPMRYGVQRQAGRDEREQDDAPAGAPPVQHDAPPERS